MVGSRFHRRKLLGSALRQALLAWTLASALCVSVGQSQFPPRDVRVDTDQSATEDRERRQWVEAMRSVRSRRAHARLGSAASSVEAQALCPVLAGPNEIPFSSRKGVSRPFPVRAALRPGSSGWRGVAPASESASGLFGEFISEQIVQSRCINCHVEGGVSGHTRLVLSPSTVEGHEALNRAVFEVFVGTVEDGADRILKKIQGVGHGGGIQVPAGSADFANMERFLRLIGGGGETSGLSPEALFDGVTMASPAKTLRRAALIFAGRLPTRAEINAVSDGRISTLRRTIRDLMTGPGFHEFLIRASNDRLLTDRHLLDVLDLRAGYFVDLANADFEMGKAAVDRGFERPNRDRSYREWSEAVQFGVARAPLELIAHVVENDLPYTNILTADYVMANPYAARAYGAETRFDDAEDPSEFRPSTIRSYYRSDDSKIRIEDNVIGTWIANPGNLATEYPHAGIFSTTVFLLRYPTTATNRNRARSRWTYYHFLGLDVEKSAARTTDPDALADTDNPTMKNSACTVCHSVLDPVAGAYQNYGEEGLYRDASGGLDSLAGLYKNPKDGSESPYRRGDTWYRDMRQPGFDGTAAPNADNSVRWLAERIAADPRFAEAAVRFWWPAIMGAELTRPPEDEGDSDFEARLVAATAQLEEVRRLAEAFRRGIAGGRSFNARDLLAEIALSPWFRAESLGKSDPVRDAALYQAGIERLLTPEELERKTEAISGYVWGRSVYRDGARYSHLSNTLEVSRYELVYGGIDSDGITVRAGDITPLMAAVAQRHAIKVSCPIVQREFFLLPDEDRRLFGGIDRTVSPVSEAYGTAEIEAESWEAPQTIALSVSLSAGAKTVRLRYPNNFWNPETRVTRNLIVDEVVVRDLAGSVVARVELETLDPVDLDVDSPTVQGGCDGWPHYNRALRREDGYELNYCRGWLDVPIVIPEDGEFRIEVIAFQLAAGDEPARLEISVESDSELSRGARAIRNKLAELHEQLLGVTVAPDSPDVEAAYQLFREVWDRKRRTEGRHFGETKCQVNDSLYFEGITDDSWEFNKYGYSRMNERGWELFGQVDGADPHHVARTWVVVLAYLLTDYRYLYF